MMKTSTTRKTGKKTPLLQKLQTVLHSPARLPMTKRTRPRNKPTEMDRPLRSLKSWARQQLVTMMIAPM